MTEIEKPLIVQSHRELLLDSTSEHYQACRDAMQSFSELVRCPGDYHTYQLTPLSVWNACSAGATSSSIVNTLNEYARYAIPPSVTNVVNEWSERYGRIHLVREGERLLLRTHDNLMMREILFVPQVSEAVWSQVDARTVEVNPQFRGTLKLTLVHAGYPVIDEAGYTEGAPLEIDLRTTTARGKTFKLREYQELAAARFWAEGKLTGGCGVLSLPCGSGKTIIGLRVLQLARTRTLIIAPGVASARQWQAEILDKTTLPPEYLGEYSGDIKQIRPVTIATYHALTAAYRAVDGDKSVINTPAILTGEPWGLVIYDEVHMLPAPMFRLSAELQSCRRLGLTGTLVREDGKELDVFSLIGPGRMDAAWKQMEAEGWIASAECTEIRVPMPQRQSELYAIANKRNRFNVAACNPAKVPVAKYLIDRHSQRSCLVMGQDLDQLADLSHAIGAPLIDGRTPNKVRDKYYNEFRNGKHRVLVLSRVGNSAIDLPEASVAIQVSGMFGSRQEEAQRLGRILRPRPGDNQAFFYSLVSEDTADVEFAAKRQLFLIEQGYRYTVKHWHEFMEQQPI